MRNGELPALEQVRSVFILFNLYLTSKYQNSLQKISANTFQLEV